MTSSAPAIARIKRDQVQLYFDPNVPPVATIRSGESIIVETEDAHWGSIRSADTVYLTYGKLWLPILLVATTCAFVVRGFRTPTGVLASPIRAQGAGHPIGLREITTSST